MLFVSHERPAADGIAAWFAHLETEVVTGAALQALEPTLSPDLFAARVPIAYLVPPSAPTYAYATVAERRGVTVRLGRGATPVVEAGRVVGVLVDGRLLPADQVLVAAGPWTSGVLDPSGRWQPIRPLWGVVVEIELADPPSHALEEAEIVASIGSGAATPSRGAPDTSDFSLMTAGGVTGVGSTFLSEEPDAASWIERILVRASAFVPAVADAPIRGVRACARPLSLDERPLIGPVAGADGLFVCAGHGPWGISTGPASARMVVDQMLGRPATVASELSSARFGSPFEA